MRRSLRHTALALAAAAALGASGPACADPVTIVTVAAYAMAGAEVIALTTAAYIALAASVIGGIVARKNAKRAAAAARDARMDALTDRCVTMMTSEPEPAVVYGRCAVGGWVIDKITTAKTYVDDAGMVRTKPDALQHVVVGIAGHECQAIHDIYMYGDWVGMIGADGWVTGGPADAPYGRLHAIQATQRVAFVAGAATLLPAQQGYTISRLISISQDQSGDAGSKSSVGTLSGLSITGGPASGQWDVTVEISKTVSSLHVEFNLGSPDQLASPWLRSVAPATWTAEHRLRGITYAVLTFDLDDGRYQGIPGDMAFEVSGRKVLDPRTGVTAWSRNAALCTFDWLRAKWGYNLALDDIKPIIELANTCDQQISMMVGSVTTTGPRYTIDGAFGVNADKASVLSDMLESMGGFASHGAQWALQAGAWSAPVMAITDDDLAAPVRVLRSAAPLDERFNSARATYMPERKVQPADVDPYSNAVFVVADGGREWGSFTFPFTNNKARARNLLRQFVEQSRAGMLIQYTGKMRLWPLEVGDRVTVTSSRFGLVADTFRVIDTTWSPGQPVVLTLQRDIAASYDDADASTADPAPSTRLPNPGLVDTPSALSAVSGTAQLLKMADGTILPRVLVSWAAPQTIYMSDPSSRTIVSWRRTAEVTWSEFPLSGNTTETYLDGVRDRDVIIIRVQHVNSIGARSQWVAMAHTVVGKTAPPTAVTSLAVTELQTAARKFGWVHVPDIDHYGYELRYSANQGAIWEQMLYLDRVVGDALSTELSEPADGPWRFAICSIDLSGNYSTSPAYSSAVLSGYSALIASGGMSGNLLANTSFSSRVTAPWAHAGAALAYYGTESQRDSGQPYAPLGTDAICMRQMAPIAGGDAAAAHDLVSEFVPVAPLVRYELSAYIAAHRCGMEVYLEFFTSSMVAMVSAPQWAGSVLTGGQQLDQWTRATVFGVAPAGAAYCRPIIRKLNTVLGQPDSLCWLLWPYLGVASASQATPSAYSPGVPRTVAQLGYVGDLDATRGAPAGTLVGGRLAETISAELVAITSDSVLSRPEKTSEIIRYNEMFNERNGILATASALGITTERTAYSAAMTVLENYLAALLPAFQDTNADTAITPATYRSTWDSAVQARMALLSRISIVSSQRASGMPLSGNLLSNTEFSGNSVVGWAHGGAATLSFFGTESQRDAAQPYAPAGSDAICMRQIGVIAGGDAAAAHDLTPEFIPVMPNVRYEFTGYIAAHRCTVEVYLEWFTVEMVAIVPADKWSGMVLTGGQKLTQWTRGIVFGVAPVGAAYCRPIVRKLNTMAGQPDSFCWLLWPYLGIAGADQIVPSEYSPGVPSSHQQLGLIDTFDLMQDSATEVLFSEAPAPPVFQNGYFNAVPIVQLSYNLKRSGSKGKVTCSFNYELVVPPGFDRSISLPGVIGLRYFGLATVPIILEAGVHFVEFSTPVIIDFPSGTNAIGTAVLSLFGGATLAIKSNILLVLEIIKA
jgi:hypothetical protein